MSITPALIELVLFVVSLIFFVISLTASAWAGKAQWVAHYLILVCIFLALFLH